MSGSTHRVPAGCVVSRRPLQSNPSLPKARTQDSLQKGGNASSLSYSCLRCVDEGSGGASRMWLLYHDIVKQENDDYAVSHT